MKYAEKYFGSALQSVIGKARDARFWKLVARELIPTWHKNLLVLIGDAAHPMLTFLAQGGNQAIGDGAALGALFDRVHDRSSVEARLEPFEQVRRDRASSLQILSNASPPPPQSVRNAASKYLPDGKKLESADDINEYTFSFDVIRECQAILAQ
ncbi:MAG: hypothetical protein M1820_002366 [Bogoriella megaspora]|nr:MAG: hypothetical protein M1820_002366 [Bogoriella megaspora]